jgi:histidyl-tRNA synthetase
MDDLFPEELVVWQHIESTYRSVAERFGYGEIRTPMAEPARLFHRTSGETSDIVSKEMYEFETKGDTEEDRVRVVLRPELTAPVMRAIKNAKVATQQGTLLRYWYAGPFFRYSEPQKGRRRQGHQVGAELIGSSGPMADAEILELVHAFFLAGGLGPREFRINSIGRPQARAAYGEAILEHIRPWLSAQSTEAQERARKNPLRLLDTKDPELRNALQGLPGILGFIGEESRRKFDELQVILSCQGIPFVVDEGIVRGLDYYTDTVFEVIGRHLGSQSSLMGGGRYDSLLQDVGGPSQPAVGFGMGIERLALELAGEGVQPESHRPVAFFVHFSPAQRAMTVELAKRLRARGLAVQFDLDGRSSKSQMRQADASRAHFMVLIGEDEVARGEATVKELATGEQHSVRMDDLEGWLRAASL